MRNIWRKALNFGALFSVFLTVVLLATVNKPAIHIHHFSIGLSDRFGELALWFSNAAGQRPIFILREPWVLWLAPLPIVWFITAWRKDSVTTKKPGQATFPVMVLMGIAFAWPFLVLVKDGPAAFGDHVAAAVWGFVAIFMIAVPVRGLFWAADYFAHSADRQRQRRMARIQCVQCGYSLRGNLSGICPECGQSAARA